jgi:ribosomal protein L7/L12
MNFSADEWDAILDRLKSDGFSPIEMIKITRAVRHVSLAHAKEIVHHGVAWSDARQDFDALHDVVEEAAGQL